jgi:CrcB protein
VSKTLALVAAGGALGALSRFGLGKLLQDWNPHPAFSVGTLAANLAGCLLMGFLVVVVGSLSPPQREALGAFLLTGFLGSLTTFSTFILEFVRLSEESTRRLVATHLSAHLLVGAAGLWVGYRTAQWAADTLNRSQ